MVLLQIYTVILTLIVVSSGIELKTIDFEKSRLCCAFCDSSTYHLEERTCRVATENLLNFCLAKLKSKTNKKSRTIRAMPLYQDSSIAEVIWIIKPKKSVRYSLRSRYIDFSKCQRIQEVQTIAELKEDVLFHFLESFKSPDVEINLDDFDCEEDFCEVTLVEEYEE